MTAAIMSRFKHWVGSLFWLASVCASFTVLAPLQADSRETGRIQPGSTVTLEYTLLLNDGSTASTNVGGEPLVYKHGEGNLLPALETELLGLEADDIKTVKLAPEQAYGAVDTAAFVNVPPHSVPEDARSVGTPLLAVDPEGTEVRFRVHEVHEDRIVLDLNHPLAGKTVTFEVRVIAVE